MEGLGISKARREGVTFMVDGVQPSEARSIREQSARDVADRTHRSRGILRSMCPRSGNQGALVLLGGNTPRWLGNARRHSSNAGLDAAGLARSRTAERFERAVLLAGLRRYLAVRTFPILGQECRRTAGAPRLNRPEISDRLGLVAPPLNYAKRRPEALGSRHPRRIVQEARRRLHREERRIHTAHQNAQRDGRGVHRKMAATISWKAVQEEAAFVRLRELEDAARTLGLPDSAHALSVLLRRRVDKGVWDWGTFEDCVNTLVLEYSQRDRTFSDSLEILKRILDKTFEVKRRKGKRMEPFGRMWSAEERSQLESSLGIL